MPAFPSSRTVWRTRRRSPVRAWPRQAPEAIVASPRYSCRAPWASRLGRRWPDLWCGARDVPPLHLVRWR